MNCQEKDLEEAAAGLLLLRHRPTSPEKHQPPAISFKKSSSSFFLRPWGTRSKRSICGCKSKRRREEEESASAAAAAAVCNRPSPATPLDFAGVFPETSTSGSEGFHTSSAAALRSVADAKVNAVDQSPLAEAVVTPSKLIRRQGRKKSMSELQAQERSLTEDKTMLTKLVESKRKAMEDLMVENKRLKNEMAGFQRPCAATEAAKTSFLLPDLNEPVLMEALET